MDTTANEGGGPGFVGIRFCQVSEILSHPTPRDFKRFNLDIVESPRKTSS